MKGFVMTVEEELKQYKKRFGELNPLYWKCGNCQYADEYGCWQRDCYRQHKSIHKDSKDYQRDKELPYIHIGEL
jgi:hypothetical protein